MEGKMDSKKKEELLVLLAMFLCGFGIGFAICVLMPAIRQLLSL